MIVIQDWIAAIPDEEKHLAYMGEHQSVTREFLLTGPGWEKYTDWGFHMDMAFDLSTVTTRDSRERETTKVESTETASDTQVKNSATTQKERYTVEDVTVDCRNKTDIASLVKSVKSDGIHLTWKVLRQHTQLPGLLRANIRALGENGEIKKTAMMVFEVDPAVEAEAAADLPQSEFEAMEEHMDAMLDAVLKNAQMVEIYLGAAETAKSDAVNAANRAENVKIAVDEDITALEGQVSSLVSSFANLYPVQFSPQNLTKEQQAQARSNLGLVVDDSMDNASTNPVQNRVVKAAINDLGVTLTTRVEQLEHNVEDIRTDAADFKQGTAQQFAAMKSEIDDNVAATESALRTANSAGSLATTVRSNIDYNIQPRLTDLETSLGDIDTALESIIAIQESLIGGDGE